MLSYVSWLFCGFVVGVHGVVGVFGVFGGAD